MNYPDPAWPRKGPYIGAITRRQRRIEALEKERYDLKCQVSLLASKLSLWNEIYRPEMEGQIKELLDEVAELKAEIRGYKFRIAELEKE